MTFFSEKIPDHTVKMLPAADHLVICPRIKVQMIWQGKFFKSLTKIYIIILHDVPERNFVLFWFDFYVRRITSVCWMFPIKHKHEHFLSIFCWMHHVRLHFGPEYIFLLSEQKKILPNSLFQLGFTFQSCWTCKLRHKTEIQQWEVQKSTETMKSQPCHIMGDPITSKSDLSRKLWQFFWAPSQPLQLYSLVQY